MKTTIRTALALLLATMGPMACSVFAHSAPVVHLIPAGCPGLFVSGGYVRAPAPGVTTVAAYGTIENRTASPVTVTGVTAEGFTGASLHKSMTGGGMSSMSEMDSIVVPAKGSVELAPGGSHIMLSGSTGVLRVHDTVRLKLQCEAGNLPVLLPVEAQ